MENDDAQQLHSQQRRRRKRTAAKAGTLQAKRNTLRNEAFGLLWYCDYCDVFVSTKQRTRKQHLSGHTHAENMEAYYNTLKHDVRTAAADLNHKAMLGVWTTENINDDWRVEFLCDGQRTERRRLDNVARYRPIQDDDDVNSKEEGKVADCLAGALQNNNEADGERARRCAQPSTTDDDGSSTTVSDSPRIDVEGRWPSGVISAMLPTTVAPGISIGGNRVRLSSEPPVVTSIAIGSVRIGDVVVSEARSLQSKGLVCGSGGAVSIRIGGENPPPQD